MNRYWGDDVEAEEGAPTRPSTTGYPNVVRRYDRPVRACRQELVTQGSREIVLLRRQASSRSAPHRPDTSTQGPAVPPRRSAQTTSRAQTQEQAAPVPQPRAVPWYLGLALGAALVLAVVLLFGLLAPGWQSSQDNLHYGYPRTYQTDAVVGHHDSPAHPSHFLALNLHRHVEVLEFPGGDATRLIIYQGPPLLGTGADLAPVTIQFKDVNGDGAPDLLILVDNEVQVYLNDPAHARFRPQQASDHVSLSE